MFFIADHGRCHIRGKQFLYDEGTRIPLIMRWPERVKPNQTNNDLVTSLDIGATILGVAKVTPPVPLHGKNLLGEETKSRKYVFAARDKMDETHDAMRSIRSNDYKLILNLMPERPYLQYNQYKENAYPVLAEMSIMYLKGELTPEQSAFFAPKKPQIELYDLQKDTFEVNNVAENPEYSAVKKELLRGLQNWRTQIIKDKGVTDTFRAIGVFPDENPFETVDEWVAKNEKKYDFDRVGWPAWYPTKTLDEWQKAREKWEPYVMRGISEEVPRPEIGIIKKKKKQ